MKSVMHLQKSVRRKKDFVLFILLPSKLLLQI